MIGAQLEKLDYRKLYSAYSAKGRKSKVDPRVLFLEEKEAEIPFAHGKGSRKSEEQRRWEALDALCRRWMVYEKSLVIMGDSRNSYSKTDSDATFMRMKDDHMKNGQLKPA